jgi:RNA polymerase sigma factor (sigma-70 family)
VQAGVLGLLRALERYDPDLGTPFWAYASWWVREAMQQLVSELEWPVVLSDRALRQLARIREAHRTHLQRDRREPSRAELATRTGIDRDRVGRLMDAKRRPRRLSEPVSGQADSGSTFADFVADPAAEDPYDRVLGRVEADHVRRALDALNTRERSVVTQRFGLDGPPQTLRELACVLGVTAERVRQIEQTGLDKLRGAVTMDGAPSKRAIPAEPAHAAW